MADVQATFSRNCATLTINLLQQLLDGTLKNIVISPFCIQSCVALAYAGADGETAEEIARGLKFVSNKSIEVAKAFQFILQQYENIDYLMIANKIYIKNGLHFKNEYQQEIKEYYHSETEAVNFTDNKKAVDSINNWVSNKTKGNILYLLSAECLNEFTCTVLLNALHFKGQWEKKFDDKLTVEDQFWICQTQSVNVQYMVQKAKYLYGYYDELNCTALEMRYKDSNLTMLILLPNRREGLQEMLKQLAQRNLLDLTKNMQAENVAVKLPKFKLDYSLEMTNLLKKLGIKQMFSNSANFNKMLDPPNPLSVSKVYHKVSIEVNEEGSEAAAATGMVMLSRMAIMPVQFIADHPFLYFIWDKKNILFAGAFINIPKIPH